MSQTLLDHVTDLKERLAASQRRIVDLEAALLNTLPVLRQVIYRAPDDVSGNATAAAIAIEAVLKKGATSSPPSDAAPRAT